MRTLVARREELDRHRALVGRHPRQEVDHVREREPLVRRELGKPAARLVRESAGPSASSPRSARAHRRSCRSAERPPARASERVTSTRKPSGPHHDSKPCLVVHSSHSSSTRARYVRSMTTFGWLCGRCGHASAAHCVTPVASTTLALLLERGSQPVEARLPQAAVLREPLVELAERLRPAASRGAAVRPAASTTKPGFVEDAQVPGDAGLVDARLLHDVVDLPLAASAAPRRCDGGWGRPGSGKHRRACMCICIYAHI